MGAEDINVNTPLRNYISVQRFAKELQLPTPTSSGSIKNEEAFKNLHDLPWINVGNPKRRALAHKMGGKWTQETATRAMEEFVLGNGNRFFLLAPLITHRDDLEDCELFRVKVEHSKRDIRKASLKAPCPSSSCRPCEKT